MLAGFSYLIPLPPLHTYRHALPWQREVRLRLAGSFNLAVSTPFSLLTALVMLFLPELHLHPDPLAATPRVLDHASFS